mmetsp:Transcript_3901/g.8576  ORF Transcript_3901/g.8576 Transcript_3901/m.8576 type:complete len:110 (-) Transcript_3901:30-359(-)
MCLMNGGCHTYRFQMKSLDVLRRHLYAKSEVQRRVLKAITFNQELPLSVRVAASQRLAKFPLNSSFSRINSYCIFSGRSRAVIKEFRMSRLVFRDFVQRGLLPGVKKKK